MTVVRFPRGSAGSPLSDVSENEGPITSHEGLEAPETSVKEARRRPRSLKKKKRKKRLSPAEVLARSVLPPSPEPATEVSDGSNPAFWRIWMTHRDYLRRQSFSLIQGSIADAEDALSQAMLLAAQKYTHYADSISNERAWLSSLVRNVCMDHYRRVKRQERLKTEVADDGAVTTVRVGIAPERAPEECLFGAEVLQRLSLALDRLPGNLRDPLLMRVMHDLPYSAIAARLDLSECAVRKRIQLARQRLKQYCS